MKFITYVALVVVNINRETKNIWKTRKKNARKNFLRMDKSLNM